MNKSHRDIKPESISDKEQLLKRLDEIDDTYLDPVHIDPEKKPQGFWERMKAKVLDYDLLKKLISKEIRLNLKDYIEGKSSHLILKIKVKIAGHVILNETIKLI